MTRAVIDTSVLVSALIGSPSGGPALVIEAVRTRRLTFVASPGLLDELAVVLARPKFDRWTAERRGARYLTALAANAELHPDMPDPPQITRDIDDDYLVALAVAANADLIVSLDLDLLQAQLPIRCVTPAQLLELLA